LLAIGIERSSLVRVFAIAHDASKPAAKGTVPRCFQRKFAGKPSGNRCVVGRRPGKGERRELARSASGTASVMAAQRFEHAPVIAGVRDSGDIGMVLRRGANHRRATDIDVLDDCRRIGAAGHRLLERIEIDHRQIDLRNLVRLHRQAVLFVVPDRRANRHERRDAAS
jgi:hypothetical protein